MVNNINASYQWLVNVCNAPNVGYSQSYRNQITRNGITYYDCSSIIWYSLRAGGFDVVSKAGTSNPFTTRTMGGVLLALGFTVVALTGSWLAGDILVANNTNRNHTEMVFSGRLTMGAHTSNATLVNQVSINSNDTVPTSFDTCYRYTGGTVTNTWVKGNRYLTESERKNNAEIVSSVLTSKGWSRNAIAGLLGNMESESSINPAIWQSLTVGTGGYGIVQWTPASKYLNWADANGHDITDGYAQLKWIDELSGTTGQWQKTAGYNFSFEDFKKSTESPEYLASAFLKNFEQPNTEVEQQRRTQARNWYTYLETVSPPWNPPIVGANSKMKVWQMCNRRLTN